ncbi:hypothetical protein PYW08_009527 [Mythimna loreyi]|uniref:Uncharacterized protein n=1 Tax=Mythimna loreyi TaxID=667449 RepID=A0ACC2Q6D2_9NEOP|nr:hypothetical protein PYW08_009527 [Mythimna loreyi]
MFRWVVGLLTGILVLLSSTEAKYRKAVVHYPLDTQFFATDFFVKGCKNFIDRCPKAYKEQLICARSYDGDFRNFANYCDMQYENCNTWKNWHVFKREKC